MANNAAIVFDEAVDASTTGIICTVVVYGVLNVWEVCCSTVKSWRRGVKEVVRPRECLPCTGPSSGPVSVPVFWTRLCTCLLDPSLHLSFGPVSAPVFWTCPCTCLLDPSLDPSLDMSFGPISAPVFWTCLWSYLWACLWSCHWSCLWSRPRSCPWARLWTCPISREERATNARLSILSHRPI
jgi:hypothetical protein